MQINAIVPSKPLITNNDLFFPHGLICLFLIINDVIKRLKTDLKKTNSYIGIPSSTFFTQTVIKLKNRDAITK